VDEPPREHSGFSRFAAFGPTDERSGGEWVLGTSLAISAEEMARTAPRRPEGPASLDRLQRLSGGIIELDRV